MAMTAMVLLAIYSGTSAWMYAWANRRFHERSHLPMQWGLDGQPNWYAPRKVALIAIPLLSGAGLIASAVLSFAIPDRLNVPEGQAKQIFVGLGVFGALAYAGYLWAIGRWDRARP